MAATPFGTWFLHADYMGGFNPYSFWLTVTITSEQTGGQSIDGTIETNGSSDLLEDLFWDAGTGKLEFRRVGIGFSQWYSGTVVEGVFVGRAAPVQAPGEPQPDMTQFPNHVTGWNSTFLDQDIVPRSYDLLIHQNHHARLRLDRDSTGQIIGRLKTYAVGDENEHEELELELQSVQWDSQNLSFIRPAYPAGTQEEVYTGTASGRHLVGHSSGGDWSGVRSGILTYGLVTKGPEEQTFWQRRTREILLHLMMPGQTVPLTSELNPPLRSTAQVVHDDPHGASRDDDPQHHPQDYQLFELSFHFTLANPYGDQPMERDTHGFLAIPNGPMPANGFPAVIAVNGHGGSGWDMLHPPGAAPGDIYWYGNAFARRGYVVLALDIEHRPLADSEPLYNDYDEDHRPPHDKYLGEKSQVHPAIKAAMLNDSDWAEDGERVWDVMRALDFLLSPSLSTQVNSRVILVTGLSMGGEIATFAAALDPRITGCIPAGFSPDLDVLYYRPALNHRCWRWMHADIRDYIDISDLHALIAPRPLIVETGQRDHTYSSFTPPFASDKQVARRSRLAYANQHEMLFVHYLHYDGHRYHVGDIDPTNPHAGIRIPTRIDSDQLGPFAWQTDATTTVLSPNLFALLDHFFPGQ